MIASCCKRLQFLLPSVRIVGDSDTHLRFLQKESIFTIRRSYSSSKSLLLAENDKLEEKGGSFTVSYLINSCGLSPEIALSVSKRVHFKSREGPDSVLNLLKHHGFDRSHISRLVMKRPKLLLVNAEKTLLPKLEFFRSIGLSGTRLTQVISYNPNLLNRCLVASIIPCYDFITSLRLLDNVKVARFFKNLHWVVATRVLRNIAPNISVLRELQVPDASISSWVAHYPSVLSLETEKFKDIVEKVMNMGVPPSSATFVSALYVVNGVNASEWAQKTELCRKWGWTEDDFLLAFRKNPSFMFYSEKNFSGKMDFLVSKMGWQPADVAGSSSVLCHSLEKWIIPRCSVIKVLLLKGLIIKEEVYLNTFLMNRKEYFFGRFLNKYQAQVPELLSIFEGKMGLAELGLGFEQKEVG